MRRFHLEPLAESCFLSVVFDAGETVSPEIFQQTCPQSVYLRASPLGQLQRSCSY
jgi:hypothetical protein